MTRIVYVSRHSLYVVKLEFNPRVCCLRSGRIRRLRKACKLIFTGSSALQQSGAHVTYPLFSPSPYLSSRCPRYRSLRDVYVQFKTLGSIASLPFDVSTTRYSLAQTILMAPTRRHQHHCGLAHTRISSSTTQTQISDLNPPRQHTAQQPWRKPSHSAARPALRKSPAPTGLNLASPPSALDASVHPLSVPRTSTQPTRARYREFE